MKCGFCCSHDVRTELRILCPYSSILFILSILVYSSCSTSCWSFSPNLIWGSIFSISWQLALSRQFFNGIWHFKSIGCFLLLFLLATKLPHFLIVTSINQLTLGCNFISIQSIGFQSLKMCSECILLSLKLLLLL